MIEIISTTLQDAFIIKPKVFYDDRGCFFESFNLREFNKALGLEQVFVQDNQSHSVNGVIRGLHYQAKHPQGKFVRVLKGEIYDVIVDLRKSSRSFGQWFGINLSEDNKLMLWVPEGFAHGFLALTDQATMLYKVTDYRYSEFERTLLWNDPDLKIDWPLRGITPIIAEKDQKGTKFCTAELYE